MPNSQTYFVLFCLTSYKSVQEAKMHDPHTLAAHMARSQQLHEQKKVLMAGAFLDSTEEFLSTMSVFASREDAEEFAHGDPYVKNGKVTKWYVREWANILG